jgi:hypothetical protein
MYQHWPEKELKEYSKGYKKTISQKKERGEMTTFEGKRPISIETYRKLLQHSLKPGMEASQYLILTSFVSLSFNLMSRSINIAKLSWNNITWSNDALVVTFQLTKSDQEGDVVSEKHVFANPLDPLVCPILHLGMKIICTPKLDKNKNTVFEGNDPAGKFSAWLQKLFKGLLTEAEITELGILAHELGTHWFRKAAATWASSFYGICMAAIYLRAGWSIGAVQVRYIFLSLFADSHIGRVLACLPWNTGDFAALPPRFVDGFVSEDLWQAMVPGYNLYPACFKAAIPKLVASVIHHSTWLEDNLPREHPYFKSFIYREEVSSKLKEHIFSGVDSCDRTGIKAVGVPETVYLNKKLDDLTSAVEMMKRDNDLKEDQRLLDIKFAEDEARARHSRTQETLVAAIEKTPGLVTQEILSHCKVNGALPVTRYDVDSIQQQHALALANLQKEMVAMGANILSQMNIQAKQQQQQINLAQETPLTNHSVEGSNQVLGWEKYVHETTIFGSTISYWLPKDYVFPSMSVNELWDAWIHGNKADKIAPYWFLMPKNERDCLNRTESAKLSKMKYVMGKLLEEAGRLGFGTLLELGSKSESNTVFQHCYCSLMKVNPNSKKRYSELRYKTVYNHMSKFDPNPDRKKKRKRLQDEDEED